MKRESLLLFFVAFIFGMSFAVCTETTVKVSKENWGTRKTSFNTQQICQVFKPTAENIERIALDIANASAPKGDPTGISLTAELYEADWSYQPKGKRLARGAVIPSRNKDYIEVPLKADNLDLNKYYCIVITTGDGDNNWRLSIRDLPSEWDENEIVSYKYYVYDTSWVEKRNHSASIKIFSELSADGANVKTHLWPLSWGGPNAQELYWAKGMVHRQFVQYVNIGDIDSMGGCFFIDLPKGVEVILSVFTDNGSDESRTITERIEREIDIDGMKYIRYKIPMFDIKAGYQGSRELWGGWGGSWCYLLVRPTDIPEGKYPIYWFLEADNFKEEVNRAVVNILPPVPKAEVGKKAYIGIWMYVTNWYVDAPDADKAIFDNMHHMGIQKTTHIGHGKWAVDERVHRAVKLAHERDMYILGHSFWNYKHYGIFEPESLEARAVSVDLKPIPGNAWNPTYIVENGPEFQRHRDIITNQIKKYDFDGFIHDYEGATADRWSSTYISFDEASKHAFLEYSGLKEGDVRWPADVWLDGKYRTEWIEFRIWQNSLYVKSIADASREAKPNAMTETWSDGYWEPYPEHKIFRLHGSDISKFAKYLSRVTVGTYVYPSDVSKLGALEERINVIAKTIEMVGEPKVTPCTAISSTLGAFTPIADPKLIRYQALRHLMDGGVGLDFWGLGQNEDGRFFHLISYLSTVYARTEDFIIDGKKVESIVDLNNEGLANIHTATWKSGNSFLVIIVNGNQEDLEIECKIKEPSLIGKPVLGLFGENYDNGQYLTIKIPSFDSVFLLLDN